MQFSRKGVHANGTMDVSLSSGNLLVMGAGCQEKYWHSVLKGSPGRISLTFRVMRDSEHVAEIPHVAAGAT
eukprot:2452785-Karenia_brevis.AAC.1